MPIFQMLASGWRLVRPFWPYLAAGVGLLVVGWYLHHRWYSAGYEAAEAEYRAAAIQAGQEFARQLAARDQALAAAQGKVTEVIKWRTRTETVYQEAVNNDPTCQSWAAAPVGCPLGLPVGPGGANVPADPAEPHH